MELEPNTQDIVSEGTCSLFDNEPIWYGLVIRLEWWATDYYHHQPFFVLLLSWSSHTNYMPDQRAFKMHFTFCMVLSLNLSAFLALIYTFLLVKCMDLLSAILATIHLSPVQMYRLNILSTSISLEFSIEGFTFNLFDVLVLACWLYISNLIMRV